MAGTILVCTIFWMGSCDGSRVSAVRSRTIHAASCDVVEFQMVRGERGEDSPVHYLGRIQPNARGFRIQFEEPGYMDDIQVKGNTYLFPLIGDATGSETTWTWLKLYCPGNTNPILDSGRLVTDEHTCYYEEEGYWITLLEPERIRAEGQICCEPLIPCARD